VHSNAAAGGAWGFKLNVFDRLLDTKSTDRKRNLMNFVAQAIAQKDASATSFKDELIDLDVAAGYGHAVLCAAASILRSRCVHS